MSKFTFSFLYFCVLSILPFCLLAQRQTAEVTDKNIKYLSYLPQEYDSKGEHPLLIFLHGLGEKGDNLDWVKRNGPPKLIEQGNWPSNRPFIVISPQLPGNYGYWPPSLVNDVVEYVKRRYKVDISRIYVTGLSLGGNGTWEYVTNYPNKVAAAVPICGWGNPSRACEMKDVPSWAFHGDADGTVGITGSINMVNGINACLPPAKVAAKLTTYPGVGHDSWSRTYDLSAGHDIYSWMLSFSLENASKNNPPTLYAGEDRSITLPQNSATLNAGASDTDGTIVSYEWTKTNGPEAKLLGTSSSRLEISDMTAGTYIFKIVVKDNDGASASDEVKITVHPGSNKAPSVYAGDDKTLTLPTNSITLSGTASDSDGSIASYSWTKASGPNANLQDTDKAQMKVSAMMQGEYIFKLTVKDNSGASASDEVKVIVNPAANKAPTVYAGDDKTLTLPTNSITLSGTASDSDGSIASYSWTKTSGPYADLQDTEKAQVKVSAMMQGEYIFKLTVKDNSGASASDEVKVMVNPAANKAPSVYAGDDKTLTLPTNSITLSGTASDSDGSIASYSWTKTSGPNANLQDTDKAQLKVSAMLQGEYIFKLTVKDNGGASASDEVKVIVNPAANKAPSVYAGDDKTLTLPINSITLSGTALDSDGSIASYSWTKASGPIANLQDTDKAQLKVSAMLQGEYIFKLTVKDNSGASASDEVKVTVNPAHNNAPTVNIGNDLLLHLPNNSATLSAKAADSDGSIVSYTWTQTTGPTASITGAETEKLSISNMKAGSYTFKVVVKDNHGASASDEAKITVNSPPTANAGYDKTLVLPKNALLLSGAGSDSDGTITSYRWTKISGGSVTMKDENTHLLSLSDLREGQYEFELVVKDNSGASASDRVKVTVKIADNKAPTAFAGEDVTLKLPENSVILNGRGTDADGEVVSFKWNQVSGNYTTLNETTTADLFLMNLTAGVYEFELQVTDDKGATASDKVMVTVLQSTEIVEPLAVSISKTDLTCFGDNNGKAEAVVSGGTGPYSYSWSTGASTTGIENLKAGSYTLTVTDAAGKKSNATAEIISPEKIEIVASLSHEEGNKGLGAIKIEISGGTAPYTTKWLKNKIDAPHLKGNSLTGLNASTYTLQVTDARGCTTSQTYTINKKGKNAIAVYPNPSDGAFKISIDASGGSCNLSIIDSKGKIIHSEVGKQDENGRIALREFDLTREGRGIYFVKVQYEFGAFSTSRIVIR